MLKFIKDNANLLTFNQWSWGSYSNNLSDFNISSTTTLKSTSDYLEVSNTTIGNYTAVRFDHELSSDEIDKQLSISIIILPLNCKVALQVYAQGNWIAGVSTGSLGKFQEVILSPQIPNNSNSITISAVVIASDVIPIYYLKEISLQIQ